MAFTHGAFTFDFEASRIHVASGSPDVVALDLYTAIKLARASEEGVQYQGIAQGSGLVPLGGGVLVGITIRLLGSWQLKFPEGAYIASISGGNLVGGPGGDPIAYSSGVQVLLLQSAAGTVTQVSGGSGSCPTASEVANATKAAMEADGSLLARIYATVRFIRNLML